MTAEYERHRAEGPSAASQPKNQGLLPLLDFFASTDGGIVGNDIRQAEHKSAASPPEDPMPAAIAELSHEH